MEHALRTYTAAAAVCSLILLQLCSGQADAARLEKPHDVRPMPAPPMHIIEETAFFRWSSLEIISALIKNGLEVYIKKGLTMGAQAAKETTVFLIPSSGENIGGLVSSYSTRKELEEDMLYYSKMNRPSAPPAWRIFRRENILLLISGKVPEEKAAEYGRALESM